MDRKLRDIGIVAKPSNPVALDLARELIAWLQKKSLSFYIDDRTAEALVAPADVDRIPREKVTNLCTKVVVLGGDGTLISVARFPAPHKPIIFGVNLGTLGFLTPIDPSGLFNLLEQALAGNVALEDRPLLRAEVRLNDRVVNESFALNDIVITKGALARIFGVEVSVDDAFASTIRGDGVIVATPAGSTAYSLSAGGSIVDPRVDAMLVTPICPHSLTSRAVIIPGSSTIRMTLADSGSEAEPDIYLTIDGQEGMNLNGKHTILVSSLAGRVSFVQPGDKNYFQGLQTKLKWGSY